MSNNTGDDLGKCDDLDVGVLSTAAVAGVSLAIALVLRHLWKKPPTPGEVSHGLPYSIVCFLCELVFWQTIGNTIVFVIFHVITHDLLPETTAMSCISAVSLPIMPGFVLLLALCILFAAGVKKTREVCARAVVREMQSIQAGGGRLPSPSSSSSSSAAPPAISSSNHSPRAAADADDDGGDGAPAHGGSKARLASAKPDEVPMTTIQNDKAAPKILFVGSCVRGTVFADCLRSVRDVHEGAEVTLLVFDGNNNRAHVVNNLRALGVVSTLEEAESIVRGPDDLSQADVAQFYARELDHVDEIKLAGSPRKATRDASAAGDYTETTNLLVIKPGAIPVFFDTLRLGLHNDHYDEIVILPFVRSAPWVGSFLMPETKRALRVVDMLRSVSNTLKPDGGAITVVDGYDQAVFWHQDVKDAGVFEAIKFTELSDTMGSVLFQRKLSVVTARKKTSATEHAATSTHFALEGRQFGTMSEAAGSFWSVNEKWTVLFVLQTSMFFALTFAAAGLWKPTDFPDIVPSNSRVNSIWTGVSSAYIFVAYVFRVSMTEEVPFLTAGSLVIASVKADLFVLLASAAFTALFWLPPFLVQWALSATDLSADNRGLIGKILSIVIGIQSYKIGRRKGSEKSLRSRGVPEEHIAKILEKV